jgi:hypothetical protein
MTTLEYDMRCLCLTKAEVSLMLIQSLTIMSFPFQRGAAVFHTPLSLLKTDMSFGVSYCFTVHSLTLRTHFLKPT